MTTGEQIGNDYPTLMPDLTDIADVQQAFKMYHFGVVDYIDPITTPIAADSIEGHLGAVNERVAALEGRPVAGGQVTDTEPTEVGTPPQAVPEGYIWVDPSDVSPGYPEFPTVIYSPTEPTGLTVSDTGTIWVDEDGSAAVLNVNNYQPKIQYLPSSPESPVEGQMWVGDSNTLYIYDGSSWRPAAQPVVQFTSSAPSSPEIGQIYINPTSSIMYSYDGSTWREVGGAGGSFDFLLMGA